MNRDGSVTATPLPRSKYQVFPPHPPARRAALDVSITHHGVEHATIWDAEGNLIEGWERETICAEKGIHCPREVRNFKSEADKFRFVLEVNAHRRPCLSNKQKREVITGCLKGDPTVADNMLGHTLGVSKNTVAKIRHRLESSHQIPTVDETRGKDGKLRPVSYAKRIITNTPNEFKKAQEIIGDLPENCAGKTLDLTTASRRARRNKKKIERICQISEPLPDDAIRLYHCRFQELERIAGIAPATANLFLTDFPYDADFLDQLVDLAALAHRVLVDGGLFVTYTGTFHLPQVIAALGKHLTYRWTAASIWDGDSNMIHPLNVASQWKPILVFSKGEWVERKRWGDVFRENRKEKEWHQWQQSLGEFQRLVQHFSEPGNLVVDPCGGGFTTAAACFLLGDRRCISCDKEADCVSNGLARLVGLQDRRGDDGTTANNAPA